MATKVKKTHIFKANTVIIDKFDPFYPILNRDDVGQVESLDFVQGFVIDFNKSQSSKGDMIAATDDTGDAVEGTFLLKVTFDDQDSVTSASIISSEVEQNTFRDTSGSSNETIVHFPICKITDGEIEEIWLNTNLVLGNQEGEYLENAAEASAGQAEIYIDDAPIVGSDPPATEATSKPAKLRILVPDTAPSVSVGGAYVDEWVTAADNVKPVIKTVGYSGGIDPYDTATVVDGIVTEVSGGTEPDVLPLGAQGQIIHHDAGAWTTLNAPAAIVGNQIHLLQHSGVSPSWVTATKENVSICANGTPATWSIIKLP